MLHAEIFGHLYDEYETTMDGLFDEKINPYVEYMLDYKDLCDEKTASLIVKFYEFDVKKLAMLKASTDKFLEVLPVKVVEKFLLSISLSVCL